VHKRIFGPKSNEVTGGRRKLYNEEMHNLYSSNIIRVVKSWRMRWVGHVARKGEIRNAFIILVAEPEGNRSLGRPKSRWVENIKVNLREMGLKDVDCIHLTQDLDRALVNTVMNLRVP
jgi:hypothetical protein